MIPYPTETTNATFGVKGRYQPELGELLLTQEIRPFSFPSDQEINASMDIVVANVTRIQGLHVYANLLHLFNGNYQGPNNVEQQVMSPIARVNYTPNFRLRRTFDVVDQSNATSITDLLWGFHLDRYAHNKELIDLHPSSKPEQNRKWDTFRQQTITRLETYIGRKIEGETLNERASNAANMEVTPPQKESMPRDTYCRTIAAITAKPYITSSTFEAFSKQYQLD